MAKNFLTSPANYDDFLNSLKEHIRRSQVQAALAVNQELILLYWQIGWEILSKEQDQGWGAKVVERLALDLKREFPEMKGFSARNIRYMKSFAEAYPDETILQRCVAKLPWRHNIALLEKLKARDERLWYAEQAVENGWSRDVLVLQIESQLHLRMGGATTNFEQILPKPQSDLANSLLKDPYHLEFLSLGKDAQERDLENALVTHIRDFLLELGVGFAFVGSQFPIDVDGREYRIDMLFYHLRLRCYVVVELKIGDFQPSFGSQVNFYISAIDDLVRHPDDQPTIGLILCTSKSKTVVEYALRNLSTPIGVATHRFTKHIEENLPSVEQLEMELEAIASEVTAEAKDTEE
ncbi:PDDEXK nuclease domain-containing protein (plasmid) [Kovacikia minuta CCNUW1]|uniref:PDDEXK nuclease domain-containing protein n=1 Tax=Kovacikia minuta TaxID=2931930 RepID=UPI001CCE0450|nr:PDDEXK nuclease domain-containing protein [Kovacikia minuta]UBF30147.1 PDDEXK nuclease domain-containing protein [Kovacikia minuta CCNUW1]